MAVSPSGRRTFRVRLDCWSKGSSSIRPVHLPFDAGLKRLRSALVELSELLNVVGPVSQQESLILQNRFWHEQTEAGGSRDSFLLFLRHRMAPSGLSGSKANTTVQDLFRRNSKRNDDSLEPRADRPRKQCLLCSKVDVREDAAKRAAEVEANVDGPDQRPMQAGRSAVVLACANEDGPAKVGSTGPPMA